jgi:AcrR family transcriptional regulator
MTRAFNEHERKVIRQKLIEKGRELFGTLGLKKTSIEDLAQAAGISKGSFYAFFDSKEELYLEIIESLEGEIRKQIMERLSSKSPLSKESMKSFILEGLRIMETDPLIRRMYDQEERDQALRSISQERLAQHIRADEDWMLKFLSEWQEQGFIIDADPRAVAGVIRLIITSSLFKDSLGGDSYPESIDLLIDLVASGLVKKQ